MLKILCVDDTAEIRGLVRTILTRSGIDVVTAASGAEGLELMFGQEFDAVILDIHMPIMDGLETLKRMTGNATLATIPVMMLTSDSQEAKVKEALALGARDFVVKPFEPRALRERVQRLLELRGPGVPSTLPDSAAQRLTRAPDLRVTSQEVLRVLGEILGLPALFSFSLGDQLTVLRLQRSKLWGVASLDELYQQTERVFARMLESGQTGFVVDLAELVDLPEAQVTAAAAAVHAIIKRATECRLDCRLVVPYKLRGHFDRVQREFRVEASQRLEEALRSLEPPAGRHLGPHPSKHRSL